MPFGLSHDVIEKIKHIFAQFPNIEQVLVFGSRAKGNYKEGSDIDLALKGTALNLKTLQNLELKLDELYLPYKIDMVIYENIANEALKNHIDRVGIVLYHV
ncbi:nucleotidyltransferase domain-containing protein [Sulfurospirillum sp.]|uniref:nucleotidyltransferase domain-containing protein n=1 Tax=Sulfurospirillum sp. TaxID=2053622 RepID=UPI002FDE2E90